MDRILLLGLMGAGKTTIGRLFAAELDWTYVDNDVQVRQARGAALDELRQQQGGEELHAAETAALLEVLAAPPPLVAGVAAWTVAPEENRQTLRRSDACCVWPRARPE